MLTQCNYVARQHMSLRLPALAVMMGASLLFGILSSMNVYGTIGRGLVMGLLGMMFCGMMLLIAISSFEIIRSTFTAPAGYLSFLAPVDSKVVLLGRTLTIVAQDFVMFWLSVAGIIWQTFFFVDDFGMAYFIGEFGPRWGETLLQLFMGLLGYAQIILLVFFSVSVAKSVFFAVKGKVILGLLVFAVTALALNCANLILAPLGWVINEGVFFAISLRSTAGCIAYALLSFAKLVALFFATAYLMERKINI